MLNVRSINNIVIAPVSTGRDKSSSTDVINIAQENNDTLIAFMNWGFIDNIVEIKLIAPIRDEIPARCKAKIISSIV